MIAAGDKRERITESEPGKRAHGSDGDPLPEKDFTNLLASRTERTEHRDVPGLIGDGHGENHQNIEARDKGDQPDENGGDQFLQT